MQKEQEIKTKEQRMIKRIEEVLLSINQTSKKDLEMFPETEYFSIGYRKGRIAVSQQIIDLIDIMKEDSKF